MSVRWPVRDRDAEFLFGPERVCIDTIHVARCNNIYSTGKVFEVEQLEADQVVLALLNTQGIFGATSAGLGTGRSVSRSSAFNRISREGQKRYIQW